MAKIAEASARCDIAELERLTKAAKRAQELEAAQRSTAVELEKLEQSIRMPPTFHPTESLEKPNQRSSGALCVTIDWRSAGVLRDTFTGEERTASKTLIGFLCEIYSALGEAALEKLTHLKISRGPLVSRNPNRDFINRGSDEVYMHHPIGQSGYFVITHNGTTEKIDAIHSAARLLGLKDAVKAYRT
jgi:hypothetical protein